MLKFPKSCFLFLNALWEWSDVYCVWYLTYFALFFFPWQMTLLTFYRLSLSLNFVISYLLVFLRELSTPSPTNSRQKPRDLHCTGWVWFLLSWLLLALYFFLLSLSLSLPISPSLPPLSLSTDSYPETHGRIARQLSHLSSPWRWCCEANVWTTQYRGTSQSGPPP